MQAIAGTWPLRVWKFWALKESQKDELGDEMKAFAGFPRLAKWGPDMMHL
jgi:hypothetical protein